MDAEKLAEMLARPDRDGRPRSALEQLRAGGTIATATVGRGGVARIEEGFRVLTHDASPYSVDRQARWLTSWTLGSLRTAGFCGWCAADIMRNAPHAHGCPRA